jgi:Rps23 Pro-64 3,4-dihydroxylase Tpa1-like proline 4-hydroxylase
MDTGMLYTSKNNEELINQGFTVIDNVLPLELANQLYELYESENEWTLIDQIRHNHYSHIFQSPNPFLPQEKEIYSAKFHRSNNLETSEVVKNAFNNHLVPLLKSISPFEMESFDSRCYKLDKSDHYRTHVDDYAGTINLIYYVNKDWRWDWGGILNVLSHDKLEFCQSIFPKFNRVVLLNNKSFRAPHFVSSVEPFALNPRYSIVSFNK